MAREVDYLERIQKAEKEMAHDNKMLYDRSITPESDLHYYRAIEGENFYKDEQLTVKQLAELEAAGLPTFTVNRLTAPIDILKYFLTANNPRWKAVGVEASDTDLAAVHEKLIEYCFNLSLGGAVVSQVVLDSLVKSIGYFHFYVDKNADRGQGEIVLNFIDYKDVRVDQLCKDFMFRDAGYIMIAKNLSKPRLVGLMPDKKDLIEKASGSPLPSPTNPFNAAHDMINPGDETPVDPVSGEETELLPYFEVYRKVQMPFYSVFMKNVNAADVTELKKSVQIQLKELKREFDIQLKELETDLIRQTKLPEGEGKILEERAAFELDKATRLYAQKYKEQEDLFNSKIQQEQSSIVQKVLSEKEYKALMKSDSDLKDTIVDFTKFFEPRITQSISIGDDTHISFQVIDIKDYNIVPLPFMHTGNPRPISAIKPAVGKQKEINKAHQIMIHHANMSSHGQWTAEVGVIADKETWKANSTFPGGIMEYIYSPTGAPTRNLPLPINNAFYTIQESSKGDIEYILGVDRSSMGMVQNADEPYRSLRARDEFNTRRIKGWIKHVFNPVLTQLGRVHLQLAMITYTNHKIFKIVNPETLETGESNEINIPIYNDKGDEIAKWNDYKSITFDVQIIADSTLPTNREEMEAKLFAYFEKGVIDDIAFLPYTDIEDVKGILARKSQYVQMKQTIDGMEKNIKNLEGDNQTLRRQVLQGNIKVDVGSITNEMKKSLVETQAQQRTLIDGFKKDIVTELKVFKAQLSAEKKTITNSDDKGK